MSKCIWPGCNKPPRSEKDTMCAECREGYTASFPYRPGRPRKEVTVYPRRIRFKKAS